MAGELDGGVSLPEDIIFDVLARLPAKALCRFRCVCKAWRALISDPTFVAAQRSRTGPHLVGVFFRACRWPPEVRVMDMEGNVVRVLEVRLLGKDDGNVFGVLQQVTVYRKRISATAMIIDPAAGRACTLDMDTPVIISSFGRATRSGALKVLRLEETLSNQICTVATIVDGGAEPLAWWRRSAPPFVTSWYPERRATVNGVVYFLPPTLDETDAASSSAQHRIAAFDLESEEWKMINGPTLGTIQEKTRYFTLTEHKGTLGFVQFQRERNDDEHYYAVVWLLIDFNKSVWVKDCTIQMPTTCGFTKLLGALGDGRILLLVGELENVTMQEKTVLVSYNPDTKTFTKFMDIAIELGDILVLYKGSLLS